MCSINILSGDIAKIPASALITAVNPIGIWISDIDLAIARAGGNAFHALLQKHMPLTDGQVVYVEPIAACDGAFESVLFVVDDRGLRLRDLVIRALQAADDHGLTTVSIPTLRPEPVPGTYDDAPTQESLGELIRAVNSFVANRPTSVKQITIVCSDPASERFLANCTLAGVEPYN